MNKTFCIVAQGGGMNSAYHVGVIKALQEKYGFGKIQRIVANSGAAVTYAYLASRQIDSIEKIWIELVKSRKFVTPLSHISGRGVIDIDFFVDEVLKRQYPLDIDAFKSSSIKIDVGVTEAETGKSIYFSNNSGVNFYELFRATCAIPYFYGKNVKINGTDYCDGTVGSVSGLELAQNEENILVILTRPTKALAKMRLLRKLLRWLLIRKEPIALQEKICNMPQRYNEIPKIIAELQKKKNIAIIQPQKNLPIFRIDTSFKRLEKTIQQGYDDVISNVELDEFFKA